MTSRSHPQRCLGEEYRDWRSNLDFLLEQGLDISARHLKLRTALIELVAF
jgi:hypothetical protein